MKYNIKNQGILSTVNYIKEVTGVDIMSNLQGAIDYQFDDDSGYIIYFTDDRIENLTGIRSIVMAKEQVEALEPIDLTGWIPVDHVNELPDDIGDYQACIVACDMEAVESSEIDHLGIGFIYDGKIRVANPDNPEDTEVTEGFFKLITLQLIFRRF